MPEENKKVLNPEQHSAITHGSGPLLIIAGAGTGKTTVITERVKHLISEGLAQPHEILALTFTEKAARQMEERIDIALPYGYTQMWVMTFHSFCDRILRDEGLHIGLNPNYRLITETEATALIRRHLFDFTLDYFRPLGNPNKFIAGMLGHISRLKDEDVTAQEYLDWAQKPQGPLHFEPGQYLELAQFYRDYETLKSQKSLMDFSDLIAATLRLFRNRPQVLSRYQAKFKYLLVDEFQDTNFAQNELTRLLAGPSQNLTVVCDDDQAIYRWRGAAISNVIQFRDHFPQAKLVVLTQNYRSTQEILSRSYDLIQHNNPDRLEIKEKINKKLTAVRGLKGEKIQLLHFDRVENEADAVAKKISEIKSQHSQLAYSDFAILVRANAHAEPFTRALSRHGLPYQFLGPAQLFHQPEIKDLIAYLKVLHNFTDSSSFFRVLSMSIFHLSPRDLSALANYAKYQHLQLFEACEIVAGTLAANPLTNAPFPPVLISPASRDTVTNLINLIHRHLGLVTKETAGQILFYFLQDSGLLESLLKPETAATQKESENIMKFFNKLKSFESQNPDASVSAVVDWLDLAMELGESPQAADVDWSQNNAVNIITIHSAKGLEFPVVFLVNLVSQRFPSVERSEPIPIPEALIKEVLPEGDHHLQEERRLFYVGLTRARDRLFLTAADYYGEGKRTKKLSPFIAETLGANFSDTVQSATQLSLLDWQKPSPTRSTPAIRQRLPITYLSFTQIQTFIDCPFHYKAKYILKLPSPVSAASSFGNTIHLALKDYYQSAAAGQISSSPSDQIQAITDIFKRNWSDAGYHSPRHAQEYFHRGIKYLTQYISTQYDSSRLPLKLEDQFTVPLSQLKIGGKIDRVDQLADGRLEIIDYKTSIKSLTPKEAETNLQLSFYALAAHLIKSPPFNRDPQDVLLSLYYFEEQKKVSVTRSPAQLEQAIAQIQNYAEAISQSDFTCSGSTICRQCDFKVLCDIVSAK